MAKGNPVTGPIPGYTGPEAEQQQEGPGEVIFGFIPLPTYQALAKVAQERGIPLSTLIAQALDREIKREESAEQEGPRLLMEG